MNCVDGYCRETCQVRGTNNLTAVFNTAVFISYVMLVFKACIFFALKLLEKTEFVFSSSMTTNASWHTNKILTWHRCRYI